MKNFKLPLVLFFTLAFVYIFGSYIPSEIKSFFLYISIFFKSILLFLLPLIIFSFISNSLLSFQGNVVKFIALLVSTIFISNSLAIYAGYFVGSKFLNFLTTSQTMMLSTSKLLPLWNFDMPILITNDKALSVGFIIGIVFSLRRSRKIEILTKKMSDYSTIFLKKIFVPVLPIFALGFILKLEHEGVLGYAIRSYSQVLIIIISTQITYVFLLYFLISGFNIKRAYVYIKHVLPATITGFSTISSAAAMSVLLLSMEKISKGKSNLYKIIVPAVINIHIIGSAIGVTILTLATMKTFNFETPNLSIFSTFAFFYALSNFAVAAIPGGVLLVIAPLLEKYLGFSSDMIGTMTVIYLVFDPFGTATNITANGGFAIGFSKMYRRFDKKITI